MGLKGCVVLGPAKLELIKEMGSAFPGRVVHGNNSAPETLECSPREKVTEMSAYL